MVEEIVQVVLKVDGELCGVVLTDEVKELMRMSLRAAFDGPIEVYRLPGVKIVPLSELGG